MESFSYTPPDPERGEPAEFVNCTPATPEVMARRRQENEGLPDLGYLIDDDDATPQE
ncbi:hypothetical protein ACIQU5_36265 [Streptomyces sp. NPDC090306]|uniref:hypothetical protein n=1 Tax=Streptomyces sp. NPDC090306 TaxID=3365961 RepID=UPI003823819D